jgi:hypothetical protein
MNGCIHLRTTGQAYFYSTIFEKGLTQQRFLTGNAWNRLLQRIAFPLISTRIGRSSELSVICKLKLSPLETYHAAPLERTNSSTAFAPFSNGRADAIIIIQNSTASQTKCRGVSFVK